MGREKDGEEEWLRQEESQFSHVGRHMRLLMI